MPLFGRAQPNEYQERVLRVAESLERVHHARSNPRVLRASGMRIEPMSAERLRAVAGNRQSWQSLAWAYRDMIIELRYAFQFRARAISRVKFYVAEILEDDDEPIAVSMRHDEDADRRKRVTVPEQLAAAAEAELARLPLDSYEFTGVWSENFDVAGDCWMHGSIDPYTEEEVWKIRSVMDVDVAGTRMTVKDELGQPRAINLDSEELYRLWMPHAAHGHLADSALNAGADVLEEITLLGRELRAASRSRVAANGILFVPESMTQMRATGEDDDTAGSRRDRFMADLAATLLAPIANEGDAGAVVPAIITGTIEDIQAIRHLRLEREDSPTLLAKLDKAMSRMANGLDIPPEILTGMADVNHWTAWQIDNATFRHHLEPSIRIMADSLTAAYLRPALAKGAFPASEAKRLRIWYDAGSITENPNRRQDALDALDRILIGPAAGREALGFNDGDAPTPEEALQLIAAKNGIDTGAATAILAGFAKAEGAEVPQLPAAQESRQLPAARPDEPAAEPDAPGGTGAPSTAPPGIAASATPAALVASSKPAFRSLLDDSRELADIDATVRDLILSDVDQALRRALERAGSRLRSKATRDMELHAQLRAYPVQTWPQRLGPEQCLKLDASARHLIAGAWESVSRKFAERVNDGIRKVVARVLRMLGLKADTTAGAAAAARVRSAMESRVDEAWSTLETSLDAHLEKVMFGGLDETADGEAPEVDVPPGLVRDALAFVGGMPETSAGMHNGRSLTGEPVGGLGNGTAVVGELTNAGAVHLGFEWRYGYMPRSTFEPHLALDGERFDSWTDPVLGVRESDRWLRASHYHPGDHAGCLCTYFSVYALPTGGPVDDIVAARLAMPPSAAMADLIRLADMDDQAGRSGTTAQQQRDQYLAVRGLKRDFLEGGS